MLTLINVNLTINPHAAEASPFSNFFVKKKKIYIFFVHDSKSQSQDLEVKNPNKTLHFN